MRVILEGCLSIIWGIVVAFVGLPMAFIANPSDFWMTTLQVYDLSAVGLFGILQILHLLYLKSGSRKRKGN